MMMKCEIPVKRIAILIGNDKWGGDLLPGVRHDLEAMKIFLQSPAGGAWHPSQIFDINTQISKQSFVSCLYKAIEEGYDYFFIYFGGHGELSRMNVPLFILPGGDSIELDEIRAILSTKPVLMISDSCQGIPEYEDGGVLNESQRLFSTGSVIENFRAQRAFDNELCKLPPMLTYASAVSFGQFANDTDAGGLYTQSLLGACADIIKSNSETGVYGICYPHTIAAQQVISRSNGEQRPSIRGYNRTYQPPFLVKL